MSQLLKKQCYIQPTSQICQHVLSNSAAKYCRQFLTTSVLLVLNSYANFAFDGGTSTIQYVVSFVPSLQRKRNG